MAKQSTGDLQRTIAVRGLDPTIDMDTVMLYFESHRSKGGPVDDVTPDLRQGVIYVTFQNSEDALRVCQKSDHKLTGKKLTVSLQRKPDMMKDRLVLRNLPDLFEVEDLQEFLKKRTGETAHTVLLGEDETVALVVFEPKIDLRGVQTSLAGSQFQGNSLTAESVPTTNTIVVRNYTPSGPDDEMIELYFDNKKRSGGGGVADVKWCAEEESFLVTFEDAEVAAKVVNRTHRIANQSLGVSLYHSCLGQSGGHKQRSLQIPAPVELPADMGRKASLLLQIPDMKSAVTKLLKDHHAEMDVDKRTGEVVIRCSITKDTPDCRSLLQAWKEDTQEALTSHFDSFTISEDALTKKEFADVHPKLQQLADVSGGEAGFVFHDGEQKISLVFHTQRQAGCAEEMKCAVTDTRRRLYRASSVKKRHVEMSHQEIKMMQSCKLEQRVMQKYPELKVICDADNKVVIMQGLPEEIAELENALSEMKDNMTHVECKFDSPSVSQLFFSAEARAVLEEACLEVDPRGIVEFTRSGFKVTSLDAQKAFQMKRAGKEIVQKRELKRSPEIQEAWESRDFDVVLRSVEERRRGTLVVTRPDSLTVVIVGVTPTFLEDVREIESFLRDESAGQREEFDMEQQDYGLFCTFLQNQGEKVKAFDLLYIPDQSKLEVTANKARLIELRTLVESFQKSLVSQTREFTQPSFMKFVESLAGRRKLREIRQRKTCILGEFVDRGRINPADGTGAIAQQQQGQASQVQQARERVFVDSAAEDSNSAANTAQKRLAPKFPRIFLKKMEDITKVEHHFFVNSSNPDLNLSQGQVSSAFIAIGGPGIQRECKQKYPKGIKFGDIAVTGPGRTREDFERDGKPYLDCHQILHCCLPNTTDQKEMKRVVREAVLKSLSTAEGLCKQYDRKSIGIPALGAGNLGYPPDLVAETMYNAVMDYGTDHSQTTIEDVYFVLHKKDDELTKVFQAQYKKYLQAQTARTASGDQEDRCYFSNQQPTAKGMETHMFFQKTQSRVTVTMKALSLADIDDTVTELVESYEEDIVVSSPYVHRLNFWDPRHIQQVIDSCRPAEVDLTLNFDRSKLTIRGHRDNESVNLLHNIIKDAEEDINERENAHLVAWQIQWNWVEVTAVETVLRPYDRLNNYRIEKAYREGHGTAVVYDANRTPSLIKFETMTEVPELIDPSASADDEALDVIRQDKILELSLDAPAPEHWSPMTGDYDAVKLNPESQEYKKVAHDFLQTILQDIAPAAGVDPRSLIDIVRIERVQNLMLHKQYMAFRKQMESKFPPGVMFEKRPLWHGTKDKEADSIVKYGFNRSFCERCSYGEAVYFAKTSNYSSADAYAARNARDERIIFYCRVLVGESMQGTKGLRFLPNRQTGGQKDFDSAVDNVKDPTIFVVFKDAQAYPEYKITFRDK